MTLTADQLSDLRADLAASDTTFTDEELDRLWERVSSAPNAYVRYRATLGLAWEQIAAGAAKFHDYEAGAVKEKLSQVFDHARKMAALYQPDVAAAMSQKRDFVKTKIDRVPHPERTEPGDGSNLRRRRNYPGI